jgi:alkylation response protein AidB-like acyl-CoA dehydrogenase
MSAVEYCICIEELARVDPSVALSVAAHNGLAAAHLSLFASEAQKQQYLVPLATGEVVGGWALTEAGAGSDAGAMRATARRDGASWVLNGSKQFITHGAIAVARSDHGGQRSRGRAREAEHSAFVVPARHQGSFGRKKENQARHARQRQERGRAAGARRVPAEAAVWQIPGNGFTNALQRARRRAQLGTPPARRRIRTQGAYEAARHYAFRSAPIQPPDQRRFRRSGKLADMATRGGAGAAHAARPDARSEDRAHLHRVVHREAPFERDRGARRRGVRQIHGGATLREGLPGREVLPRREALQRSARAPARFSGSSSPASC